MSAPQYPICQYGRKPAFSSFLPGVAGESGIPLWCFYVNRGQCIAGFGSRDKNHSIMEFSPAHTAYQRVQTMGFRTFVKMDGVFAEPFADGSADMLVGENGLKLSWSCPENHLRMDVSYFIVPDEKIGMLCRRVRLTNTAEHARKTELLDGLAAIVPFGLSQFDLKMMCQTAKAWMMTEGFEQSLPYFRLRASLVDTTSVEAIEDGSFGAAACRGHLLPVIVDPAVVFSWDTSFARPLGFEAHSLSALLHSPQRLENELPCCFFGWDGALAAGEALEIDSLYGLSHGAATFHPTVQKLLYGGLDEAQKRADSLFDPYLEAIRTSTADPLFDRYCRQSYLDNFLRGGVPHLFASGDKRQLFYLFSRKHGDLERDYNDFIVTPECYSQGNGNFRDVLQNRRSDVRFCPECGWAPLKPFLEFIQSDGYNPLVILPASYVLEDPSLFHDQLTDCPEAQKLLENSFSPGSLATALGPSRRTLLDEILCASTADVNASFGEGYWVDHWIYLLDMLESYLSVYPESRHAILSERCLRWYESRAVVRPLRERIVEDKTGLRQHNALDENRKEGVQRKWLCDSNGTEVLSTAFEKLFMLCVLKFAVLDHTGEAVSMEAGKPGWYDALNGLPGLFGSSTAESCELWRLLRFLKESLNGSVLLPASMSTLAVQMAQISGVEDAYVRWQQATAAIEAYREATVFEVSAAVTELSENEASHILDALEKTVSASVKTLISRSEGVFPTYFINLPESSDASAFSHVALPPFLEGPVHALRLPLAEAEKRAIVDKVYASPLFDQKLQMYKVSADLSAETPELGRANAFTRGWLEHESIWLHMEYKYLLELLKNGFYDAFFRDFGHALIPFQPPQRYGRSVLENSSFLASSANPDPGTHGRGFVARLSGATAEFLEMWQILFFGQKPFRCTDGSLSLKLCPTLPARLIRSDCTVSAMFLGHTPVTYRLPDKSDVTPTTHCASTYHLTLKDGTVRTIEASCVTDGDAEVVRSGGCTALCVELKRR